MAGTSLGGRSAAATNKTLYGDDFYRRIGAKGGKQKHTRPRGFAYSKANGLTTHIEAGRKGGKISKRGPAKKQPKPSLYQRFLRLVRPR